MLWGKTPNSNFVAKFDDLLCTRKIFFKIKLHLFSKDVYHIIKVCLNSEIQISEEFVLNGPQKKLNILETLFGEWLIFMRVERLHVQRRGTRGVVFLEHVSRYHVQQTAVSHWSYKFVKLKGVYKQMLETSYCNVKLQ